MSYILEALKRAEAERERDAVPGLNAQPQPADLPEVPDTPRPTPAWVWAVGGVAVGVVGLLGWRQLQPDDPPPPAVSATLPIQSVAVAESASAPAMVRPGAATAAAPAAAPPPAANAGSSPPSQRAAVGAGAGAGTKAADATSDPAIKAPDKKTAKPPPPAREARPAAATVAAAAGNAAAPAAPASADTRVYALNELPDEVRRSLPSVTIGGAMYSQNPANRILIVAGQLLREGDMAAPNVFIERIKLRSAVLRYRGYLYEVTF
jgi:general secretion pathway protein B